MKKFEYLWRNNVSAVVGYDMKTRKVIVTNFTDDNIKRPFGVRVSPTFEDLERFFESRCFPKERYNLKRLLDDLGLNRYDPFDIVEITHGRQYEDYAWIRFEGEDLDYERDIKLRD
jgi:hypothetical protein